VDHPDAQDRVMRYLPGALCAIVAAVAIAFGVQDHVWIEPAVIVACCAAFAWATSGKMGA
jgi:hypothetical protein